MLLHCGHCAARRDYAFLLLFLFRNILESPVTEREFLESLQELNHKINFVKEQSFKDAKSCSDVRDVLEKLKIKVSFEMWGRVPNRGGPGVEPWYMGSPAGRTRIGGSIYLMNLCGGCIHQV